MKNPNPTDPYIQAILDGDSAKLRDLYQQFFPMIRHHLQDHNGSENDAKDIFQDALLVIFEKAKKPGFKLTSGFSSYLFGISQNLWRNHLRKKSRKNVTIPEDDTLVDGKQWDAEYDLMERLKLYDKHFLKLGDLCQKILSLSFQKKPTKEIAQAIDKSEEATRQQKLRCQKKLSASIKMDPVYKELK